MVWPLLPDKSRWVRDASPVKVAEKSRRIGLSWTEAYDDVLHAAAGRGAVSYASYNKDATAGWIGDCQDWAAALHGLALLVDEEVLEDDERQRPRFSVRFPSGKHIEALPSVPRAIRSRGRPGDRAVLDEVAFMRDPDAMLQAATALRIWGGRIRIISTHNGEHHPFAALVEDARSGALPYALHTITFDAAVRDGLYRRILAVQAAAERAIDPGANVDEFTWSPEGEAEWVADIRATYRYPWMAAEELDCIPAPGAGSWIALEDYLACQHAAAGDPAHYGGGPCWVGYDVARRAHLAVIAVLEQVGDVLWLRELVVMQDTPYSEQRARLGRLLDDYRVVRVAVDATGMGDVQAETLQETYGRSRIEPVVLSTGTRLDVATALRTVFEDARIRVGRDRATRDDVRSMRRAAGVTGAPRLYSEDSETDGHADRFWALALAAASAEAGTVHYAAHRLRDGAGRAGPMPRGRRGDTFRMRHQPGGLA